MKSHKYTSLFTVILSFTGTILLLTSNVIGSTDAELENQVADFMKSHRDQRRSSLTYNSILAGIARQRAYDMGKRNYYGHVDPDGIAANYLVTEAGYELPDFYGKQKSSNNIESIAAGSQTAEDAWKLWMNSPGHRTHILGLSDFYSEQVDYGIGHAFVADSYYKHYWVILTARAGRGGGAGTTRAAPKPNRVASSSDDCLGTATSYPNVLRSANGNLKPVCGYVWADDSDSQDYRVKLMLGLYRTGSGSLHPAEGYTWVNPDDPKDYRVRPLR